MALAVLRHLHVFTIEHDVVIATTMPQIIAVGATMDLTARHRMAMPVATALLRVPAMDQNDASQQPGLHHILSSASIFQRRQHMIAKTRIAVIERRRPTRMPL